ncbi:MAG: hypothetical protein N2596_06185 [Syntrophorhabdaceae bacterium]|nr:hypothetical protein [Syntrophorhabdaceae bacterium]
MTRKDEGNFAGKRKGIALNEKVASLVKARAQNNRISCVEAHKISSELNISPEEVGVAIDLLEIRIVECQLGLFGYGTGKNIPVLKEKVEPEIEAKIRSSLVNGKLPCIDAWNIAIEFNISKLKIAAICESMKIKISACQLGAFG